MKNVIFGALALTMVSGAAHAACSDIPNPTRFNPTELSDYQECWLDTFKSDEVAGVLGSIAWVKLDGQYFSASLSEIRKNPGSYSEAFIAAITPALEAAELTRIQNAADDRMMEIIESGRISELEDELAMVKMLRKAESLEYAQTIAALFTADQLITAKASAYGAGKAAMKVQLDTYYGAKITALVDRHAADIAFLESRITEIKKAAGFTGTEFWTSEGLIQHLKDINWMASKYDGLKTEISGLKTQISNLQAQLTAATTPDFTVAAASSSAGDINHALALSGAEVGDRVRITGVSVVGSVNGYIDYVRVNDDDRIWNIAGVVEEFNNLNPLYDDDSMMLYYDLAQVQAFIDLDELESAIGAAAAAAYSDGYEDGYRDGYNDGYADGAAGRSPVNNS